jgi:hypothetical protein
LQVFKQGLRVFKQGLRVSERLGHASKMAKTHRSKPPVKKYVDKCGLEPRLKRQSNNN